MNCRSGKIFFFFYEIGNQVITVIVVYLRYFVEMIILIWDCKRCVGSIVVHGLELSARLGI